MIIEISKGGHLITSVDEWFKIAPPKEGLKQWKLGRSAMEMAKFALSDSFADIINHATKDMKVCCKKYNCEPEALTHFPGSKNVGFGSGGPRNHDLLMIGDDVVIGIEAKVSEHYDKPISTKRQKAEKENNQNKICRLNSSLHYLFGDNVPESAEEMYYQLFSATIGTILEAKKQGKTKALALFITFTGNVSLDSADKKKTVINDRAFADFYNALDLDETGKIKFIPGLGNEQIDCWIKCIKVNLGLTYVVKE